MDNVHAIEETSIREVTLAMWEALVGSAIDASEPSRWSTVSEFFTSRVRISGAWSGDVAVHCSPGVARHITAVMFASAAEEISEVADALGEIANVVAGNLKAFLPSPARLSTPVANVSGGSLEQVRGGSAEQSVWFECDGQPFVVELVVERMS